VAARHPLPDDVAKLMVEAATPGRAPQLVFSGLDSSVAGEIEAAFAQAGHTIVSNSRNYRMEADVPLLIPEVNADHLALLNDQRARGWKGRIVTNRTAPSSCTRWRSRRCASSG
jgi:aspartate-semialdehyde dehydrogenase